jgi:hypothetical protein
MLMGLGNKYPIVPLANVVHRQVFSLVNVMFTRLTQKRRKGGATRAAARGAGLGGGAPGGDGGAPSGV